MKRRSDYNDRVFLRQRDVVDVIAQSRQSDNRYFMYSHIEDRTIWMSFKDPLESSVSRLYALYYKIRRDDHDLNICIGLWRKQPSTRDLHIHLLSLIRQDETVIHSADIHDFLSLDENKYLVMRWPNFISNSPTFSMPMVPYE